MTYGHAIGTLPTPTRAGYTFGGWYTAANGQGTKYDGSTVYQTAGNLTLYADWAAHRSGGSAPAPAAPAPNFVSDTTQDFSVNDAYQFKITSTDGSVPSFVVGTDGVIRVELVSTSGGDYYFKITAIGPVGAKAGIYVNGVKLLVVTVGETTPPAAPGVKCDTTEPFAVKAGGSYVFRITAGQLPTFVAGTGSVFKVQLLKTVGNDYFFRITAVGEAGQAAGFYINSGKTPVTVATIA